ncbi:CBN-RNR-2 protein [Aphelenchoides avenae]|nr:CBN-RNR-2 protein [Aphelenchus avenae]
MSAVKKIDVHSENAFNSGLNIFTMPPTNVSIHSSQVREILAMNPVDTSPYEFRIFSDNQWLDLSKTYLYLQLQVEKKTPEAVEWGPLDEVENTRIAAKQSLGTSFVNQLKMHINGNEVYDSTKLYPYMSYIKNELHYSNDVKDTWLSSSGFYRDSARDDANSSGFKKRAEIIAGNKTAEFLTRLDFDLANQSLYLLNNLEVVFTIYKNDDRFLLHYIRPSPAPTQEYQYRIKMHKIRLFVKSVDVQPSLNLSIMNTLQKTSAKYPIRRTEIRSTFLTPGRTDYTYNAFTNVVPRQLIVAMVGNKAYNGHISMDPFNFKPFKIAELLVYANGTTYPHTARIMSWDGFYQKRVLPFIDMHDYTMGMNVTNGITPEMFRSGWTPLHRFAHIDTRRL